MRRHLQNSADQDAGSSAFPRDCFWVKTATVTYLLTYCWCDLVLMAFFFLLSEVALSAARTWTCIRTGTMNPRRSSALAAMIRGLLTVSLWIWALGEQAQDSGPTSRCSP